MPVIINFGEKVSVEEYDKFLERFDDSPKIFDPKKFEVEFSPKTAAENSKRLKKHFRTFDVEDSPKFSHKSLNLIILFYQN